MDRQTDRHNCDGYDALQQYQVPAVTHRNGMYQGEVMLFCLTFGRIQLSAIYVSWPVDGLICCCYGCAMAVQRLVCGRE